jgi:hypothetical protein
MLRSALWVLWPSFLVAGIGIGIVFTLVDPMELVVLGYPVHASRMTVYSLGFFVLWGICAASSAITFFLQTGAKPEDPNTDDREK